MNFRHERIDADPPSVKLGFCETADLTGNGRPDVIIGGAGAPFPGRSIVHRIERQGVPTFPGVRTRLGLDDTTVFWYENPGWERHEVVSVPNLDVGATLCDITGTGRPNVLAGQGIHNTDVYWFELPDDPRERWTPHLLTDAFEKYHDLAAGDVDGDGEPEIVGLSQGAETLFYYDIPDDPFRSPWPDRNGHVIDDRIDAEGLSIVDIDGDGVTEIVAGTSLYHREDGTDDWRRERVVADWDRTRVAVADLDRDGEREIVYSEGDSPHLGTHPGRVAWFDPPGWEPTILEDGLFCPHSLQVADFDRDGHPDVYVAEMGLGKNETPRHLLFRNGGDGTFTRETVATGIETHEAKAVDLTGNGRPDVVGKSYGPDHHVDVWFNEQ
jgi:hypothetical protein